MTEMQNFALNARKSLEIANLIVPGLIDRAKSGGLHAVGETFSDFGRNQKQLCLSSFWWVISRIIHAVSTVVLSEEEYLDSTPTKIYSRSRDSIFGFASDFDEATAAPGDYIVSTKQTHYVRIESLVSRYVRLGSEIDAAISSLRPPLKPPAATGRDADDRQGN